MHSIIRLSLTILGLLLVMPTLGLAQVSGDGLWTDTTDYRSDAAIEIPVAKNRFRLLRLDVGALNALLTNVPREDDSAVPVLISIPLPSGGFSQFEVVESAIMEAALAAKFPELKTYRGIGLDDPSAVLRLSVTPMGLHGQVLTAEGSIYIDPAHNLGDDLYISYRKRDYQSPDLEPRQCLVGDDHQPIEVFEGLSEDGQAWLSARHGDTLRTYRLALATTGEYTQFHGGTVGNALAAVVVSMNRVNGIYERDLGVRMLLVADNDQIIYTNPSQDPYSNSNGSAMLDQNQSNLDRVIGVNNYDIGHVFSTGGGGVAYLNAPCRANRKAGGVTGQRQPIGDPFDVDYVAHEMGHQFGANHTFNGNQGSCSGGNRNAGTAYEPGSGTTIMGYAGICGSQNIQRHSDAYFHAASLDEIINFITGSGNACAVRDQTNNLPPTADAGPAFTIPADTPFELTGSATDENVDALTYIWEQMDRGQAGSPNNPAANAPLFRSFSPSDNPTRIFPQRSDLLNGNQTLGELLPSRSRTLNFWLTVRDNHPGGGGIDQDAVQIAVDASAGPFRITAPSTAVTWDGNARETVTWNPANTDNAPISCDSVDILFSQDGGNSFSTTVLSSTPNDGSQTITVPNTATSSARLKVICSDNVFFDVTDTDFTVRATTAELDLLVANLSTTIDRVESGNLLNYNVVVINQGNAVTAASYLRLVLSSDAVIDGTDLRLSRPSQPVPELAGSARHQISGAVRIPAGTLPGGYFLGAIVDPKNRVSETDETNNSGGVPITVIDSTGNGPDLIVDSLSATTNVVAQGALLNYTVSALNQGTTEAGKNYIRLVLSRDSTISNSRRLTRPSLRLPVLAVGTSHQARGAVAMPADVVPGDYFLGAIVDPSGRVTETDESNNVLSGVAISVTAAAPK